MIYNSLSKQHKSITGAIPSDTKLTLRVKNVFDSVLLLIQKDGEEKIAEYSMFNRGDFFEIDVSLKRGLYFYWFKTGEGLFLGKGNLFNAVICDKPEKYQLTVFDKDYKAPDWIKGGVIYQIFPDRFYSSKENFKAQKGKILREDWGGMPRFLPNEEGEVLNNDFFGGDLKGITQKLDYLKSLSVNCVYLNPIFKAYSNHRYDTGNYMEIDPLLGDITDLKELIDKASEDGIKIVLDGVFNHTGSDSLYFNKNSSYEEIGAYQSKNSKYYSWFNFRSYPNDYESWWGIKTLPATNKQKGGYRDFIVGENGVLDYYTRLGVAGWRLDVVDEIPGDFVKDITTAVKNVNDDAIIIGEVWEDASNKISYGVRREYFQGKELDSVMNYPLKDCIIDFVKTKDPYNLINVIYTQIDHYPNTVLHSLMNILSTHDTFRIISALSNMDVCGKSKLEQSTLFIHDNELKEAMFRVKVASILQYTLCGVPSLYYGDEIGMQGFVDPLNRMCFDWGKIGDEMVSWYRKLGEIRTNFSCLRDGSFELVFIDNGVFIYKRIGEQELLVTINISNDEYFLDYEGKMFEMLSGESYTNEYKLKSNSIALFVLENG